MPAKRGATWGRPPDIIASRASKGGVVYTVRCAVCTGSFDVRGAHLMDTRRCRRCVDAGRKICHSCGRIFVHARQRVCAECKAGVSLSVTDLYVGLTCRGARVFGGVYRAQECETSWRGLRSEAIRKRTADLEAGTYVCRHCCGLTFLERRVESLREQAKQRGERPPRVRTLDEARDVLRGDMQRWATGMGRLGAIPAGDLSRIVSSPNRPRSVAHRGKLRAAKWSGGAVPFSRCEWCGLLVMGTCTHHRSCRHARRRTAEAAEWSKGRTRLRKAGLTASQADEILGRFPPLPPGHRRYPPRREVSTRQMGWAVAHLLGGEKTLTIARRSSVTEPAVRQGITAVLGLLPEPASVAEPFGRLINDLRYAERQARQVTSTRPASK